MKREMLIPGTLLVATVALGSVACGEDECVKAQECCDAVATVVGGGSSQVTCEIEDIENATSEACEAMIDLSIAAAQSSGVAVPSVCE